MGTRSVVAVLDEASGLWRGKYVHWDGYPTHLGFQLHAIVYRDGLPAARQQLVHAEQGWSGLDFQAGKPGHESGPFQPRLVPGYGWAYDDLTPERAWRYQDDDPGDLEWAYVLHDEGLIVYAPGARGWRRLGQLAWTVKPAALDALLAKLEAKGT